MTAALSTPDIAPAARIRPAPLMHRGSLKADLVLNVGSQFFLRLVTALTALYAARVLGPEKFGAWAVLQVLFMYTAQGHFGTANAMMREVPLAQARGEHQKASDLVNSTWSFITLASVLVTGLAGAIVLWFSRPANGATAVVLGSMWLVFVQLQSVFFQFYCRANSSFKVMAAFSVAQACLTLPLCVWLIPRWGIAGYLSALAAGFTLIPIAVLTRPGLRFRINVTEWRELLAVGMPMLPGALMLYLNMSVERLALAAGVSAVGVGMFAAGAFFFQIGATLWELVIYTWYARLAAIFGATGEVSALARAITEILPGAIWVSSAAQGAAFLALPYVLTRLLPGYSESIAVSQVLMLVMNLWGLGQFLSFALTIIGRQKRSMALQGMFLALKLGLLLTVILVWHSVLAVAVASGAALVFYVVLAWRDWQQMRCTFTTFSSGAVLWATPLAIAVGLGLWGLGPNTAVNLAMRLTVYAACITGGSLLLARRVPVFTGLRAWTCAK